MKDITLLLREIVKFEEFALFRAKNKMRIDSDKQYHFIHIEYDEWAQGIIVRLEEDNNKYWMDYESVELTIDELELSDEQWDEHIRKLREEREQRNMNSHREFLIKEQDKKIKEIARKTKELEELKKEFLNEK